MLHIAMAFFAVLGTYLHIALIKSPKVSGPRPYNEGSLTMVYPTIIKADVEHGHVSVTTMQFQIFVVLTEISAAIWAFDRAARFVSRFYLSFSFPRRGAASSKQGSALISCATGTVRAFGTNSQYTRLRIAVPSSKLRLTDKPKLMGGIAGGDDIRITIPRLQWVGEHPFTVFAVGTQPDDPSQGYIDLLIKTEAGLTRRIVQHFSHREAGEENDLELATHHIKEKSVSVMIEGPFGIIPDIQGARDLVLVSGGIAITFCWPLFVAAIRASGDSKLNSCKLIWIVRDQSKSLSYAQPLHRSAQTPRDLNLCTDRSHLAYLRTKRVQLYDRYADGARGGFYRACRGIEG